MTEPLSNTQRNILVTLLAAPGLSSYRLRTPITVTERLVSLGLLERQVVNGGKQPRYDYRYILTVKGDERAKLIFLRRKKRSDNARHKRALAD